MSNADSLGTATHADVKSQLSPATPSLDRPWDSLKEVLRRVNVRQGDRATGPRIAPIIVFTKTY